MYMGKKLIGIQLSIADILQPSHRISVKKDKIYKTNKGKQDKEKGVKKLRQYQSTMQ